MISPVAKRRPELNDSNRRMKGLIRYCPPYMLEAISALDYGDNRAELDKSYRERKDA